MRKKKRSEVHDNISEVHDISQGVKWKDLPRSVKAIVKNSTFLTLLVMTTCNAIVVSGFSAFGPKYIETQYKTTAGMAGILFGKFVYILTTFTLSAQCESSR